MNFSVLLARKRKLRRNLRKSMERLLAPEKHFASVGANCTFIVNTRCLEQKNNCCDSKIIK